MSEYNVIVRIANIADLQAVQQLNHELFMHDQEWFNDLDVSWPFSIEGAKYFESLLRQDEGVCFIAEIDASSVGYLVAGKIKSNPVFNSSKRLELENMLVQEKYRGHGIGGKLLEALNSYAKEHGVAELIVTAFAPNKQAISFYKKSGFSEYSLNLIKKIQ